MKNLLLLSFTLLLLQSNILAQAPDTHWTKTYGGSSSWEGGNSVQQTNDGGYIIAGYSGEFFNSYVYLIKTNSSGDTLWTKTFRDTVSAEGQSVQQTGDGGYIIAGSCTQRFDYSQIFLIKTDSAGDMIWKNTYGGSSSYGEGNSVQQTSDGGYILAGSIDEDVYLIKTDSWGDTLWTKTFGGTDIEVGNSVQQTSGGGYIVVGSTWSFGTGSSDVYLIKTNSSGDTLWTKTFGGTGYEAGKSVQQTSDGGYIVAGSRSSFGAGSYDIYLIKTNASGDTLWTKTFGGSDDDRGNSVQQTSDGGYIAAGSASSGDIYLIKTNSSGDIRWTKIFVGIHAGEGSFVQQTSDDGYIITGSISGDICLIKLAPNYVYIYDIISDKNYYSTGQDTVHISTIIENLNSHQLTAKAYIYNLNDDLFDSTDLTKQAMIKDAEKWTGEVSTPQTEDFFKVSVNVFDHTISDHFIVTSAARFTTSGPLKVDSIEYVALSNFRYGIKPIIKNEGYSLPIRNIKVKLYCNDPWVTEIYPSIRICYDILPGDTKLLPLGFSVTYDSTTFPGYFNLEFEMLSDGCPYWTDSSRMTVVTGIEEELSIPSVFSLAQNFPNPFNPSTTIKYSIPKMSFVTIKIYDVLGSEVTTLVNEEKSTGTYEIEFKGHSDEGQNLTSGVYFYKLSAGNYVETKKMVLLK